MYVCNAKKTIHQSNKIISQNWHKYDKILLYHARKSGGTSLRFYLQPLAQQKKLEYEVIEGVTMSQDRVKKENELWVTSIRHPIPRVLSSYQFEGRWAQYENKRLTNNSIPLNKWLPKIHKLDNKKTSRMYACVSNCFTKWFGGWDKDHYDLDQVYTFATERLNQFDLIIINELMGDPKYVHQIEQIFNSTLHIGHRNAAGGWSGGHERYKVSYKSVEDIADLNYYDMKLYAQYSYAHEYR